MRGPVANVFPTRDPGATRLAIVGEAPGADEVALGYPFAGKSGWWLNQWLAQAGISRYSCFVGNVCQMRPSHDSNEFDLLEWNGPEVQAGIAALQRDLEAFKPNCILALGNAALHLFRHGNVSPGKSAKLNLFQWPTKVGVWRGSLFEAARSFDCFEAADLRVRGGRRAQLLVGATLQATALANQPLCVGGLGHFRGVEKLETSALASVSESPATPHAPSPSETGRSPGDRDGEGGPLSIGGANSPPTTNFTHPPLPSAPLSAGKDRSASADPQPPQSVGEIVPPEGTTRLSVSMARQDQGASPLLGARLPSLSVWKVLSTYHPASTFREPSFTYPLVNDIKRAVVEATTPTLELPRRDIVWGLSADEIERRCVAIRAARTPVGFDIEGGLGGLQCCSFATTPHDAFVIDLMERDLDYFRKMAAIATVLEDPSTPKVLWNAMYERSVLQAVASITLRGYEDGMLAWWERFSELPKGLDFVASILTREPYWSEGIGWDKRTGAPKVTGPAFWLYNGIDSCVTLEIWEHPLVRCAATSTTPVRFNT